MALTFNGVDLSNYINYVTNISGLEMPQTRDLEVDILQRHGSYYTQTFFQSRIITLQCVLLASDTKNIYQRFDDIKKIIIPTNSEKILTLNCYDDRFIYARYSGSMTLDQRGSSMNFSISFRCSDPLFYSNQLYTNNLVNGNNVITNNGTFNSNNLTLSVVLPYNQDVVITNNTLNQSITLRNNLGPGNITVLVNFRNGMITSPDLNTNYIKFYKAGTFFTLAAGANAINCTGLGTGTNQITHRYAFI